MTDIVSVPLDLVPTPLFRKKYNISYSDSDFDGTEKFEIVFSNLCPDNIPDCLNSNGTLNTTAVPDADTSMDIALELVEQGDVACYVKIAETATVTLSEDVDVKGMFLRKKTGGFVLMAMVNQKPMRFCEGMTFEADNILFILEG